MASQQTTQQQAAGYDLTKVIRLAAVAAIGGFLFGFDTAVINGAVNAMSADFAMGTALTGFVVVVGVARMHAPAPTSRAGSPTGGAGCG